MNHPLVTVICLCYNQSRFVEEAIASVAAQTYPSVELIVVDDCSTDDSADVIRKIIGNYANATFLPLSENHGHTRAFNHALASAQGDFIIDLAADDVLMPERIARGVEALSAAGDAYGVNFTDAEWMSEEGKRLYPHSDRFPHSTIPQGDVYKDIIERFFICSPTMMFRRNVIEALGGYDPTLHYEDFDFWVRSARRFHYCYTPEVLVKKRIVRNSMSDRQFSLLSPQLRSTYRVCEKILELNRSPEEHEALKRRVLYEMRVSLRLLHFPVFFRYLSLYRRIRR